MLTQGFYLLIVAVLTPLPAAMILYELANTAEALFSHANLSLPPKVEKVLRLVLVTPGFHRTHHSTEMAEQQSNLSVLFSFWDRLFRTYRDQPRGGEDHLELGLEEVSAEQSIRTLDMLKLPFAPLAPTGAREYAPQALAEK